MSDRIVTEGGSLLARPWRPAAVHGIARSMPAEPHAPWFGVPGKRGALRPASHPAPGPVKPPRAGLWAELRAAWRRQRTRRCLVELDARTLKDIGVSYAEAEAEANKPFWVR